MTQLYRTPLSIFTFFCFLLLNSSQAMANIQATVLEEAIPNQQEDSPTSNGSCDYILELFDSFGDGWNGGVLTITINGVATAYTLDDINDDGSFNAITINIPDSAQVQFEYVEGGFPTEVSYNFINPNFESIFSDGPGPVNGLVFDEQLICPTCIVPTGITIDEIGAVFTSVSWTASPSTDQYILSIGEQGMPLDSFINLPVNGTSTTINGLQENTAYEFFLTANCEGGETSPEVGPFNFTTLWLNDVGVANILGPQTACGLGTETITLTITNYGELPQSLFNFRYSVNGELVNVPMFTDGFFTAVVGTSDTIEVEFQTQFDFSQPGDYTIAVWTELEADSSLMNDTIFFQMTNIPVIVEYPYFNDFESGTGGWSVAPNSQNASWAFGNPAGNVIDAAASGQNAWVTNLTGIYNVNELSYLTSPCFDFSTVPADPLIRFSIYYDTEFTWDGAWLEGSQDGGTTWQKIGNIGTGENWYNFDNINIDLGEVWAGQSEGWIVAEHPLPGYAGVTDALFRFGFGSDASFSLDGVGIDDIYISPPLANDLSVESGSVNEALCGSFVETINMEILNDGLETQTGFSVFYQVNDEPPVSENVGTLTLSAGMSTIYTFDQPFPFLEGTYTVKVWTGLGTDGNTNNDTTSFEVTVVPVISTYPYFVNFENADEGWRVQEDSENSSWELGAPNNFQISNAVSGQNAWVTNLTGNYNTDELSYLISPCFDFSGEIEDPVIRFAINFDTELEWDGAWLEGTQDGGLSWQKIGTIGSGVNWYTFDNDNIDLGEVWAGSSGGWINAEHPLDDYAGVANCQFRFGFGSDASFNLEGVGIDDIFISPPLANDLAALSIAHTASSDCGSISDSIVLDIRNGGTMAQTGFDVVYQIGDADPVVENVGALTIEPETSVTYVFSTPFDSRIFDNTFEISAWVALDTEQNTINDSTDFSFTTIVPDVLPLQVDFEDFNFPPGWTSTGFVDDGHNAPSVVANDNLFEYSTEFELLSFPIGPINPGDSLTFDYRYVDFPDGTIGTILGANQMIVQISADCGNSFTTELTIDANNHITSANMANRKIDLDAYAGEYITIRFFATWAEGDYFVDIDNINIIGCPENLALDADISPESEIGAADGGIFIDPLQGTSPYSYNWSTGDMTALIIGLTSDTYTVTVTDGNGCVDISSFDIVVCPDDLNIGTSTVNESFSGAADGSISVNPQGGTAPYEFEWNTGQNTAMIENLMAGSYSVTVTDVNGCNEVIEIELDIEVSTKELDLSNSLSLRPNPTNDRSTLVLAFPEAVDVEVRLHNSLGQLLYQTNRAGVQQTDIPLDLSTYSSGMYLVSIRVADQIHVERLILNR